MSWTTPTTRSTGDLITAAIWNADIVDNLNYLKTEVDKYGALLTDGAETVVNATAAETTIFTGSVPGGTLSTNKILHGRFHWQYDSADAGRSFTIRVKYGGTTLLTFTSGPQQTSTSPLIGEITFMLRGDGATNAQEARGFMRFYLNNDTQSAAQGEAGTAVIDSTAAQNLVITVQHNDANANATTTSKGCVIEGAF